MSLSLVGPDAAAPVVLTIRKLTLTGKFDASDEGFVDVHTTEPVAPFVLRIPLRDVLAGDVTRTVPSNPRYECLVFHAFVYCVNAEGRTVPNRCGTACAARGCTEVRLVNYDGSPALGSLQFTVSVQPWVDVPYPLTERVKARSAQIVAASKTWYARGKQAVSKELDCVHVPTLACPFPHLPGCFFTVQTPEAPEREALFESLLRAAAGRRGVDPDGNLGFHEMCLLTAEALAAFPNCMVYNADTKLLEKRRLQQGRLIMIEAFCADPRTVLCGDCDDMAREVLNVAHSLKTLKNARSRLVRAAQEALSHYAVAEVLGAVALDADPRNRDYSTGTLYAHAFVMFLPLQWLSTSLRECSLAKPPADGIVPDVLTQDGIALFDPEARRATNKSFQKKDVNLPRIRTVGEIGLEYYMYLCTAMILDESVVSDGVPVREVRFQTGDRYGATYADVLDKSPAVTVLPSVALTADDDAMARRCVKYFHPIVPVDTAAGPSVPSPWEVVQKAPASFESTFFVQGNDWLDKDYMSQLEGQLSHSRVVARVDSFGKVQNAPVFTVQVYTAADQ